MAISTTAEANFPKVYVGDSLDALTYNSRILCNAVNTKIGPHISTASIQHKYGFIKHHDQTDFSAVETLDLRGKFCKITLDNSSGVETVIFYGQIFPQTDIPYGTYSNLDTDVPTGNNQYTAYGLEFLLDRVYVSQTYSKDYGNVKKLLPFNGLGPELQKNRSAIKSGDSYIFEYSDDSENWTALDILEYLFVKFAAETGLSWTLDGEYAYLQYIKPNLDPRGKTLRMCINEIVQPSSGFSYIIEVTDDAPVLKIISITDTAITLGANTLVPASTLNTSITAAIETNRDADNVQITQVEESAYNFIRVYSEPVRVMATFNLGVNAGGLNTDWESADEAAYGSATDFDRQDDQYDKVYTAFRLTDSYDKKDYNAVGIVPLVDEDNLTISYSAANPWIYPASVFERRIITKKDTDNPNSDYNTPVLFVKEGSNYLIADKSAYDGENQRPPMSLIMANDGPGIYIKPPYNHLLAKNTFTDTSAYESIYDFNDCLLTASFYTDSILAYKVAGVTVAGESRTKNIYIPGLHYWVAAPSTKLDLTNDSPANWTAYRDDTEEIKRIASLAKAWYGRLRNNVIFSSKKVFAYHQLGYMATSVYTGGSFTPVGTVISAIDYMYGASGQRVTITTDFKDVNFSKLSMRSRKNSNKATAQRIARLEERVKDIPVRTARGGGNGDTYSGYFKATKTADTKVTIAAGRYQLNLFTGSVAEEELTMSQTVSDEYIYLEGDVSSGSLVVDLKSSTTFPEDASEKFKGLVCAVSFSNNVISNISNQHRGIMRGVIIE